MRPVAAACLFLAVLPLPTPAARGEIVLLKNGQRLEGEIVVSHNRGILFREKETSPGRYYPYEEVSRISTADGKLYYLMPRGSAPPPKKRSGFFPLARMLLSREKNIAPIPCIELPKGEGVRVSCEGADDAATLVLAGGGRVHLLGIEPPPSSLGEAASRSSARHASELVKGKEIWLFPGPQSAGRTGQPEAYAVVDGRLLNAELLEKGWARAGALPRSHPYREAFGSLERFAKNLGAGIWGLRSR